MEVLHTEQQRKSRIKIGIPIKTLVIRTVGEQPIKPYQSQQLKPRISLPQLSSQQPLSRMSLLQQYEFPLQQQSAKNRRKPESKPIRKPSVSEKVLKPPRKKLHRQTTEQEQLMHRIILNAVLTEQIEKTLNEAGDAVLDNHKPKQRVLRGDAPKKRNLLLQNLEQSVLFPKVLQLRPSRLENAVGKLSNRNFSQPYSPERQPSRFPQLAKPRSRIYDLAAGNIDGWKDNQEEHY